ncbi:Replication factor A 3 [Fusarium albosuccineum]|uniref:Replication factor A 3 n=1 Tax=Fusarium albosuccineum TaxID=1237068 RepID=A0A8H4LNJ7_9HYPO|nr:Replication factor A 3 [Fusarium albosuccineum]
MAEQMSTPRITAAYLDNFVGRVVMLVGKVTQLRGEQATLDSEGSVTVLLNRDAHLANGSAVQVIGKVNPDLSIKVLTSRDLGTGVDHGPYQYSQAYTPRVAMVWTSPAKHEAPTSPTPQRQASYNYRYGKSNATTPDSASTSTIRSTRPSHNAYAAAQRLQRTTQSPRGHSRPTTAMSSTTSSSDMIFGRNLQSRSPSPSPSYLSRTPTPTPRTHLPSPPEEDHVYASYSTDESGYSSVYPQSTRRSQYSSQESYQQISQQSSSIPSAQPYTPLAPLSPQSFSSASLLPSPPLTQPRDDPFGPSRRAPVSPARRRPAINPRPATLNSDPRDTDSALLDSVVEGIGRIHVTMGRDDAGRWRIKRPPDGRS